MCVCAGAADVHCTAHWERYSLWDGRSGQVSLSHRLGATWLRSSVFCIEEIPDYCANHPVRIYVCKLHVYHEFFPIKIWRWVTSTKLSCLVLWSP